MFRTARAFVPKPKESLSRRHKGTMRQLKAADARFRRRALRLQTVVLLTLGSEILSFRSVRIGSVGILSAYGSAVGRRDLARVRV